MEDSGRLDEFLRTGNDGFNLEDRQDTVGTANAILAEMRQSHPPVKQTSEQAEQEKSQLLTELKKAEWLIGAEAATETTLVCSICGAQNPLRGAEKLYLFRTEAGGSLSLHCGESHAVHISLCPQCSIAAWDFLMQRQAEEK